MAAADERVLHKLNSVCYYLTQPGYRDNGDTLPCTLLGVGSTCAAVAHFVRYMVLLLATLTGSSLALRRRHGSH